MNKDVRTFLERIILSKSKKNIINSLLNIGIVTTTSMLSLFLFYILNNIKTLEKYSLDTIEFSRSIILIAIYAFGIIKIPKVYIANSKIKVLLSMPIKLHDIFHVVMKYILKTQITIFSTIYFSNILNIVFIKSLSVSEIINYLIIAINIVQIICIIDYTILILSYLTISRCKYVRRIAYTFSIISIPLMGGVFSYKKLSINSTTYSYKTTIILLLVIYIIRLICLKINKLTYAKTYIKVNLNCENKIAGMECVFKHLNIKNKIIKIEILRLLRNSAETFKQLLKSILVVVIFSNIFAEKYSFGKFNDRFLMLLFIITLMSGMNGLSVCAYSNDLNNIKNYIVLPIKIKDIFKSKVIVSFSINQCIIVILLIVQIKQLMVISNFQRIIILVYSITNNYIFTFLGVALDRNNCIFSLRNNFIFKDNCSMNKIIVMFISIIKFILGASFYNTTLKIFIVYEVLCICVFILLVFLYIRRIENA